MVRCIFIELGLELFLHACITNCQNRKIMKHEKLVGASGNQTQVSESLVQYAHLYKINSLLFWILLEIYFLSLLQKLVRIFKELGLSFVHINAVFLCLLTSSGGYQWARKPIIQYVMHEHIYTFCEINFHATVMFWI